MMAGPGPKKERKKFRVGGEKYSPKPPIEFDLELPKINEETGEPTGEFEVHLFHTVGEIPGALLLDIASSGIVGNDYQASAMRRFFEYVIVEDERETWAKVVETSRPPVPIDILSEIMGFLIGELTAGPTDAASS